MFDIKVVRAVKMHVQNMHSVILYGYDKTTTWFTLYCLKAAFHCDITRLLSSRKKPEIRSVAELTAAARYWHWPLRWNCETLLHLTLIDLSGERELQLSCSKLENYHFKEVPRKVIPLNKTPPSIHQRTSQALWESMVTTKSPGESAELKFLLPKASRH